MDLEEFDLSDSNKGKSRITDGHEKFDGIPEPHAKPNDSLATSHLQPPARGIQRTNVSLDS